MHTNPFLFMLMRIKGNFGGFNDFLQVEHINLTCNIRNIIEIGVKQGK